MMISRISRILKLDASLTIFHFNRFNGVEKIVDEKTEPKLLRPQRFFVFQGFFTKRTNRKINYFSRF